MLTQVLCLLGMRMLMSLNYQTFMGFCGTQLRVIDGLAIDDSLDGVDALLLDDVYQLSPDTGRVKVQAVADQIRLAHCRTPLSPDALLTFMTPTGQRQQAILLSAPERTIILPLGHMGPSVPYRLIACDITAGRNGFQRARSGAFARGTLVTMADGSQRQIEQVQQGDVVHSTSHGVQTVAGRADHTQYLSQETALVRISSGSYGNEGDLLLRPEQRFFAPSGQVNIATLARDAVNDTNVYLLTSGTMAVVQLFFDKPCAIHANGLAVETHIADLTTTAAKPANLISMLQMPAPSDLAAANTRSDKHYTTAISKASVR